MKIPGLSVPVSEIPPGEKSTKANSPATGKTAASVNSQSVQSETPLRSQFSQAALFKALGLPADRLSASIVSFAKFFSLPLEPSLLANVRRQADARLFQADLPEAARNAAAADRADGGVPHTREALSLAALAAADKGVELSPGALAEYAAAIDPDSRGSGQGGSRGDGQNRQGGESADGQQRGAKRETRGDTSAGETPENAALSAHSLKERFSPAAEPLLDTLNRLPGANGQRWLVFPLDFTENGARYRVTLRLLLGGEIAGSAGSVRRAAVEVAEDVGGGEKSGADRRWLFLLDSGQARTGSAAADYRLTLMVKPARRQRELDDMAKKLARCMDLSADRVTVRNYGSFSCAPDSRDFLPDSVNTEV